MHIVCMLDCSQISMVAHKGLIDVTTVIALEVHKAITITICIAWVLDRSQISMVA